MADLAGKLLARTHKANGCWPWTGTINGDGYGTFSLYPQGQRGRKATHGAHRLTYEVFVGPIPSGMTIDHTCHPSDGSCAGGRSCLHRRCVNPGHLQVVPFVRNVLRGVGPTAENARKDRCVNGHPYDAENTYIRPKSGNRDCRACIKVRVAAQKARNRAKVKLTKVKPVRPTPPPRRATHCPSGHEYTENNTRLSAIGRRICRACEPLNAARQRVSECPKGHSLDAENTYVSSGRRGCRECRREVTRRWRRAKRQVAAA